VKVLRIVLNIDQELQGIRIVKRRTPTSNLMVIISNFYWHN